jgi:micrococcal nuclease
MQWLRGCLALVLVAGLAGCEESTPTAVEPGWSVPASVSCQFATVRHVSDGDTIRVDLEDGPRDQRVRYIGIDAPELVTPSALPDPFAEEAARRNADFVRDRRVCLEKDVSEVDRFGRLLRYVWLPDGTMVNEALLSEGFATVATFPPDVKYAERLLAAQQRARAAAVGLWGD